VVHGILKDGLIRAAVDHGLRLFVAFYPKVPTQTGSSRVRLSIADVTPERPSFGRPVRTSSTSELSFTSSITILAAGERTSM
jgi:hypothetical protein